MASVYWNNKDQLELSHFKVPQESFPALLTLKKKVFISAHFDIYVQTDTSLIGQIC